MAKWKNDIIKALTQLGGIASLTDLYTKIKEIRPESSTIKRLEATVNKEIQMHSPDSTNIPKREDLFYASEGIGKGVWGLINYTPTIDTVSLTEDDIGFPEGKKMLKKHILRERNPRLIFLAKEEFKKQNGKLFCQVCDFLFEDKYGKLGEDFIEAHHIKPVSEMVENETTNIIDLVMVCSNCHKMLHRKRPWITKEKLKSLLQ